VEENGGRLRAAPGARHPSHPASAWACPCAGRSTSAAWRRGGRSAQGPHLVLARDPRALAVRGARPQAGALTPRGAGSQPADRHHRRSWCASWWRGWALPREARIAGMELGMHSRSRSTVHGRRLGLRPIPWTVQGRPRSPAGGLSTVDRRPLGGQPSSPVPPGHPQARPAAGSFWMPPREHRGPACSTTGTARAADPYGPGAAWGGRRPAASSCWRASSRCSSTCSASAPPGSPPGFGRGRPPFRPKVTLARRPAAPRPAPARR
jgi:hypothetical protein